MNIFRAIKGIFNARILFSFIIYIYKRYFPMRSLSFALALLLLQANTLKTLSTSSKMQKLAQSLSSAHQSGGHTCQTAINRIKKTPIDHTTIIGKGLNFTDSDFNYQADAIWWSDFNYGSLSKHQP